MIVYEVRFNLPGQRCPGESPCDFVGRHQKDMVCRVVTTGHEMESEHFRPVFQMGLLIAADSQEEAWCGGQHLVGAVIRPGEFFAVVHPARRPETLSEYLCDLPEYAVLRNG